MIHPTHFVVPFDLWMKIALEGNDPWPIRAKKLKELVESCGLDFSQENVAKRLKKRFPLGKTDIREAMKAEGYAMLASDIRAMRVKKQKTEAEILAQLKLDLGYENKTDAEIMEELNK